MNTSSQPEQPFPPGAASGANEPFAVHLDPDQLSAFLENALPEPERVAALRHLAECAGCRELAFLAQTADPAFVPTEGAMHSAPDTAAAEARPIGPRPGFLSSFGWLWNSRPALRGFSVAALAGCLAAVLFFQLHSRFEDKPNLNVAVTRPADPTVAAPDLAPAPAASPEARPSPRQAFILPLPADHPSAAGIHLPPAVPNDLPMRARRELQPSAPESQASSAFIPQPQPLNGMGRTAVTGLAAKRAGTANSPIALVPSAVSVSSGPVPAVPQSTPGVQKAAAAPRPPAGVDVAAAPASVDALSESAAAPIPLTTTRASGAPQQLAPAANETVEVSAATIANINVSSAAPAPPPEPKAPPQPLPSKLPSRASVAMGRLHLELDAAGTLFRSHDEGRHWKRVKPRWPGAIQTLELTPQSQFQLTTTSDVVWLSTDGLHWHLR